MKNFVHSQLYLTQLFLEWEMFQTKVAQKLKTSILCSINFFFFENRVVISENVEKYRRAGQATDDNMAHPHYMLDTYGYRHTHTHTQNMH